MVAVEVRWQEELSSVGQSYSPSLLTTTVNALIICLATCLRQKTSKSVTYNNSTKICGCYDSLANITPLQGNHLWSRKIDGYTYNHQLGWYIKIIADQWLTHPAADASCANDGARLIVLDTVAKHTYITGLPGVKYGNYYHIGGTDEAVEGTFVWETGSVVQHGSLWAPLQPDNHLGNQNCMVIFQWKYDDVFCTDTMNFICEMV
ncbi:C-type lectin domain family 6 member A-like [Mizuhopecten yessoensis]|uniref:C-type lectin domain family 6 member A-like n=1 Tax=Mizuhopecten yessoensis TaxID=6573 RepID=UPI000B45C317|nr:C-type lectin domain family 6 member A-like [Mizuhopecten yessoensis]